MDIASAIYQAVENLRKRSPIDTGNLRYNAIKVESVGEDKWRIYVDEDVAPYMPYTNEPWTSAKWRGVKNRNEGWWDKAVRELLHEITGVLGGQLEEK